VSTSDMNAYRIKKNIGSIMAVNGLDFTAELENSYIRKLVCTDIVF
jgi:hypothetical protein